MSHHHAVQDNTAIDGGAFVCAQWIDSGISTGLVVVDSNRPPVRSAGPVVADSSGALRKQIVAKT